MAQLPPDGTWLMQEVGGTVILFHRYTEKEIARFDPGDPASVERAFEAIAGSGLGDEATCFAYFWAGYFSGHALYPPPEGSRVSYDKGKHQVVIMRGGDFEPLVVHTYDAGDRNLTAQAQSVVHFSAAIPDADKPMVHFWCGYFWATVGGEG